MPLSTTYAADPARRMKASRVSRMKMTLLVLEERFGNMVMIAMRMRIVEDGRDGGGGEMKKWVAAGGRQSDVS